jgi:hypothetical protein
LPAASLGLFSHAGQPLVLRAKHENSHTKAVSLDVAPRARGCCCGRLVVAHDDVFDAWRQAREVPSWSGLPPIGVVACSVDEDGSRRPHRPTARSTGKEMVLT